MVQVQSWTTKRVSLPIAKLTPQSDNNAGVLLLNEELQDVTSWPNA